MAAHTPERRKGPPAAIIIPVPEDEDIPVDFFEIPDDIDAGVAARMERQQFLYRGDRRYNVILGEQALHTNIGGPDVMRGQLDRLLATMLALYTKAFALLRRSAVYGSPARDLIAEALADLG